MVSFVLCGMLDFDLGNLLYWLYPVVEYFIDFVCGRQWKTNIVMRVFAQQMQIAEQRIHACIISLYFLVFFGSDMQTI